MTHTPSPSPALIHRVHAQLVHELAYRWGHLRPTRRLAHTFGFTDNTTYLGLAIRCSYRVYITERELFTTFPPQIRIHTTPRYLSPLVMGEVFRLLLDGSLTLGDVLDPPPPPPPMPASTIPRYSLFHVEDMDIYDTNPFQL